MNATATGAHAASGGAPRDATRWRVLAVLLIAVFMSLVCVSIVNVALPSIRGGLHTTLADLQWVLSGYALTFGVVLVPAGRAGDLMGRGGIFVLGVALFTAASVAAGFAPSAGWLNVARFVQGFGSGFLAPQAMGMIQHYFRGDDRGRAFGFLGSTVGVAVAVGPVLGGFLIKLGGLDWGWRLTFLVNVPVGALATVLALCWFPRPLLHRAQTDAGARVPHPLLSLDPVGSVLVGLAVLAVLFPFVEFHASLWIWLLLPAGLGLAAGWVAWERWYARRGQSPMVDLRIFATSSFSNGTLIMALYFLGMTSVWVLVALYMQDGLGMSALEASLVGIPAALLAAWSASWAGVRVAVYGRKVVIGGLVIGIIGLLSSTVVVLAEHAIGTSVWWLLLTLSLVGIAQGSVISPNQTLTLSEVPLDYAGSSGAIMQTGQRIGTSVGIAVITAAVFATLPHNSWAVAVTLGFLSIALVLLVALAVAFKDLRDRGEAPRGHAPVCGAAAGEE
ncbi:MAG TPA: MFS transporter [Nevskiaceae bacterium]